MKSPKIFVTTYNAYNSGKQFVNGQYVDIDGSLTYDQFVEHCEQLVKESDPEFMCTDFEGFSRAWYSESGLPSESTYEMIVGYANSEDQEMVDAFLVVTSENFTDWSDLENKMNEQYIGQYANKLAYADDLAEQLGYFAAMEAAGISLSYFDTERFLNDLECGSEFAEENGYYFDLNR